VNMYVYIYIMSVCTKCMYVYEYIYICKMYICRHAEFLEISRMNVEGAGRKYVCMYIMFMYTKYVCIYIHVKCIYAGMRNSWR